MTSRNSQTRRVFSVGAREEEAVAAAARVRSAPELADSLAVDSVTVRPVPGLHELVVVRPVTRGRHLAASAPSALRPPRRVYGVVHRNAGHYLHAV